VLRAAGDEARTTSERDQLVANVLSALLHPTTTDRQGNESETAGMVGIVLARTPWTDEHGRH
jgi:hypothetical protein